MKKVILGNVELQAIVNYHNGVIICEYSNYEAIERKAREYGSYYGDRVQEITMSYYKAFENVYLNLKGSYTIKELKSLTYYAEKFRKECAGGKYD